MEAAILGFRQDAMDALANSHEANESRDIIRTYQDNLKKAFVKDFGGWKYGTTHNGFRFRLTKTPEKFFLWNRTPEFERLLTAPQFRINKDWFSFRNAEGPDDDLWRVSNEDLAVHAQTVIQCWETMNSCELCNADPDGVCWEHQGYTNTKFCAYSQEAAELHDEATWFGSVMILVEGIRMPH